MSSHQTDDNPTQASSVQVASPWRCLFAGLYDALVLLALVFVATAIVTPFIDSSSTLHRSLTGIYLLMVIAGFYLWFWTHGGQTIGMRAWRLQLQQSDGSTITLQQGLFRFITALPPWAGLVLFLVMLVPGDKAALPAALQLFAPYAGWLCLFCIAWILIDNRANGWRNTLSRTRVIVKPKR